MSRGQQPIFLARQSYRGRRYSDAARLLPVAGIALLFLPILWADSARTSGGLIYIFVVWALLIVAIGLLSRRLSEISHDDDGEIASRDADDRH